MKAGPLLANAGWCAASAPEYRRYRAAAGNVERTQRSLLAEYLERNADTAFGRAHGFAAIRSWEEYRERVPARTYDEYRPFIEQIASGSPGILTAEPVKLLEPSSGSAGAEKWVPYTATLQAEFRRAVAVWITRNFLDDPRLLAGRAYWSLTPQRNPRPPPATRIPIGFDADSAYLGGIARRLVDLTLVSEPALKELVAADDFWHATCVLLLKCPDLRLVSVWHPSYILLLLGHMRAHWTTLLGSLGSGLTRTTPKLHIAADPRRAAALEQVGPDPSQIWPELALISCWGDGHAASYLDDVRAAFPGVRVQPKGLVATEAFVTLPLGDARPLAARSHFFELIDDSGNEHPAWDTDLGGIYSLVVTTGGGLYRYRLMDKVEVGGYYREIPSLRFLGKADNVSDLCGEKLAEPFVAAALATVFARCSVVPEFAMLAPEIASEPPHYVLYVQCSGDITSELDAQLELELEENPNYALCRRLGQLLPVRSRRVARHGYEVYAQRLMQRGQRLGDIKPTALSVLSDWSRYFHNGA